MLQSPVFLVRKGTRSRPNVKIPKVFDSHYEERLKEATVATIVREPHTDQNDPLIGVEVEEIKAEPVDVDESAIEVEENMVNYIVQGELILVLKFYFFFSNLLGLKCAGIILLCVAFVDS